MKAYSIWLSDWEILLDASGNILISQHKIYPYEALRALGIDTKTLDASGDEDSQYAWYESFSHAEPEERIKMFDELWNIGTREI